MGKRSRRQRRKARRHRNVRSGALTVTYPAFPGQLVSAESSLVENHSPYLRFSFRLYACPRTTKLTSRAAAEDSEPRNHRHGGPVWFSDFVMPRPVQRPVWE